MELIDSILGAMHLPGLTFFETIGAGAAMYFGVVIAKAAIDFASNLLLRARRRGSVPVTSSRRGR